MNNGVLAQVCQIKIFFAIFKKNIVDANQSEVILVSLSLRPQVSRPGNTFCKAQKQAERAGSFSSL